MGVLDKIKNVFFEEEYVEVEEKEKPIKVKDKKKEKEKAVAKKIELPEIKKEKEIVPEPIPEVEEEIKEVMEEPIQEEDFTFERETSRSDSGFKFPIVFEEEDFKEDSIPVVANVEETKSWIKEEEKQRYVYEDERAPLYEGREARRDKPAFRPTPIISPIYGILDKNYKKEEIVSKKEIILSSSSSKKMDVDSIRDKAFGDLSSDITSTLVEKEEVIKEDDETPILYDLSGDSPAVEKVTVGDAEEYFNDLGLEYNIDYKDNSLEKATGRRIRKVEIEEALDEDEALEQDDDQAVENNLFDLIESMYEDKED